MIDIQIYYGLSDNLEEFIETIFSFVTALSAI